MLRNSLITAIFSTALMACGGGGGANIGSQLDEIEAELAVQATVYCDCYAEFGVPSREMCEAFWFAALDATTRACVIDAFNLDKGASSAYLDCALQAEVDYTACGETNLSCADLTTIDACDNAYFNALEACPTLPANVDTALDGCFPQN